MYGKELREKIISARKQGISVPEICRVFGVSPRMVFALSKRYRETGSVEPRKGGGRKSNLSEKDLQEIEILLTQRPDITLSELRDELNLPISISNLSRTIRHKLGYTYKKRWFMHQNRIDQMSNKSEKSGKR